MFVSVSCILFAVRVWWVVDEEEGKGERDKEEEEEDVAKGLGCPKTRVSSPVSPVSSVTKEAPKGDGVDAAGNAYEEEDGTELFFIVPKPLGCPNTLSSSDSSSFSLSFDWVGSENENGIGAGETPGEWPGECPGE